jgi:GGDEF domain-containing protein
MPRPLDPGGRPESPLDLEALAKELHRARRYGRSFSLAIFAVDLDGLAQEIGPGAAQTATRGFAAALSRIVRDADTLARASDGEHHLLLPETERFGARVLVRRAWDEIRREPAMRAHGERPLRRVSIGAATFPGDGEDRESLLHACRRRQGEWRSSMLFRGAGGLCAEPPFWRLADALLDGEPIQAGSPSARLPLDPEILDSVEAETGREIGRNLRARSIVYLARRDAGERLSAALPELEGAARQGDIGSRVYVLGARAPAPGRHVREHPLITRLASNGDRRLAEHSLLLFLSESASYALLQSPDGRIFHSSDEPLVDALAEKLEARYRLQPPPEPDDARARIEGLLRRDGARGAADGSGLQGSLARMPLADLLQILAMNRETGRLQIARDGARGEIALVEGQVADAAAGAAGGEKALYRLLSWREGRFVFASGGATPPRRIEKRLEELVLEGVRQSDEAARLLPALPAEHERLRLSRGAAAIADGMHPAVAEVAARLARPCTVAEVLDGASASDLDVLRALVMLLEAGHARREPIPGASARTRSLLAPRELSGLRRRIARAARGNPSAIGKVVLAGGGPLARRSALVRIGGLPGFSARADGAPVAFGTLGRLAIGEGASVDLVALPSDPAMTPLWRPFAAGAIAALVLSPAEEVASRLAELAAELRMTLGACGPSEASVEPALRSAPAACGYLGADPAEALQALLASVGAAG